MNFDFDFETSQFLYYSDQTTVPLLFSHCCDLKIHNISVNTSVFINKIPGIIGVNICGKSEIVTLLPDRGDEYPLVRMLIYFTDGPSITPSELEYHLNISSNVITSHRYNNILNNFTSDSENANTR